MSQIAHTLRTRIQVFAVDTQAEPPCSEGSRVEHDAVLPGPSEAQARAAELPLAQMAALLTAGVDETPFFDDLEPDCDVESDLEVAPRQSAVVTVPPPLTLAARVRTSVPPPAERAELQLEDLSLRMDNPYRASSLVPPAAKTPGKGLLLSLCAAAAGVIIGFASMGHAPLGLGGQSAERASNVRTQPVAAAVPAVAAPIAQIVATPMLPSVPSLPVSTLSTAEVAPALSVRAAESPRAPRATSHSSRTRKVRKTRGKKAPALVAPAATIAGLQLPRSPSRQDILVGFGQLRGEFQRCAAGKHGVAQINARILNSGRISRPHVAGEFENSPASLCMERAVRNFSFAPFSEPDVRVQFPVAI